MSKRSVDWSQPKVAQEPITREETGSDWDCEADAAVEKAEWRQESAL